MGDGGFAWGLMISSADGNVLLSGVKWGAGFNEVEIEEAMACFFCLQDNMGEGVTRAIFRRDFSILISKLTKRCYLGGRWAGLHLPYGC